ncbi:hypothetical protein GUJ93_ZPchr0010g8745 [Zizania palustris]|uniref:Uncharacterized protein n=1 Tax=Zizania palustris TaxID=103762 RepID=A0A8J5WEU3_ZIZPA|nr:hypothetical protein GUJ93_ZPchr0010g8745 [Zizania palustris]
MATSAWSPQKDAAGKKAHSRLLTLFGVLLLLYSAAAPPWRRKKCRGAHLRWKRPDGALAALCYRPRTCTREATPCHRGLLLLLVTNDAMATEHHAPCAIRRKLACAPNWLAPNLAKAKTKRPNQTASGLHAILRLQCHARCSALESHAEGLVLRVASAYCATAKHVNQHRFGIVLLCA